MELTYGFINFDTSTNIYLAAVTKGLISFGGAKAMEYLENIKNSNDPDLVMFETDSTQVFLNKNIESYNREICFSMEGTNYIFIHIFDSSLNMLEDSFKLPYRENATNIQEFIEIISQFEGFEPIKIIDCLNAKIHYEDVEFLKNFMVKNNWSEEDASAFILERLIGD